MGSIVLIEAGLSYLGLGAQAPTPSWGRDFADARTVVRQYWWLGVFPGLAISLVIISFNLLGDALRDVLDPRLRGL
jgi:peptide/nickel transport system permease protein